MLSFRDQRNELISLHHANDAVIVEFWLLGTHEPPLGRLEPTVREFRCRMTAFFISREQTWCVSACISIQQLFAAGSRVQP